MLKSWTEPEAYMLLTERNGTANPHPPNIKGKVTRKTNAPFPILDLNGEVGSKFSMYIVQGCSLV